MKCPYDYDGWCKKNKWCNDRCMDSSVSKEKSKKELKNERVSKGT